MSRLVTANEFFGAVIALLRLREIETLTVSPELDRRFEEAYEKYSKQVSNSDIYLNFSFKRSKLHGDSRRLRETMFLARHNNLIGLDNPSFRKIRSRLSREHAVELLKTFPAADKLAKIVDAQFTP